MDEASSPVLLEAGIGSPLDVELVELSTPVEVGAAEVEAGSEVDDELELPVPCGSSSLPPQALANQTPNAMHPRPTRMPRE